MNDIDIDALWHSHAVKVHALAMQITLDRELADDTVQETFLAAHRARATFRGDSLPSTWLYRIAVRVARHLASRRRADSKFIARATAMNALGASRSTSADTDPEAATRALAALALLPEDQRLALVLLRVRDLPGETVAELLGVPIGTVYSRASLAAKRLRELLDAATPKAAEAASSGAEKSNFGGTP
jgi:RNA polymerase sigma-70 factor (ECF subfamily)